MYRGFGSLLYADSVSINDKISIRIPTVKEVLSEESDYYALVQILTAMPIDMMAILDDMGIDFSIITDYQMFLYLFPAVIRRSSRILFGDLDLSKFVPAISKDNGEQVLLDTENDIVIDRGIYMQISDLLREIHGIEKNMKKPANGEAKEFMLELAHKKARRARKKGESSILEPLIVSLVNTEQFKYNFEDVGNMTIYQFYKSLRQVINKINYDNRMIGVYTGNINSKDLSQEDYDWLNNK